MRTGLKNDLCGKKFGMLTVVRRADNRRSGGQSKVFYECKCECGRIKEITAGALSRGATKSCGCSWQKYALAHPNWSGFGEIHGSYISQVKFGARSRGIEYNVSTKFLWSIFLKQNRACALSGMPIQFYKGRRREDWSNTASLDRIDSMHGYIDGNVQWLHKDINLMKNHFDQDKFLGYCRMILNLHPQ